MARRAKRVAWVLACVCLLIGTVARAQEAEPAPTPVTPLPPVPVNLMTNSDFEIDADRDGVPDGWFHSEPQYWAGPAQDSDRWTELRELWVRQGTVPTNIPLRPPDMLEGGRYGWEVTGYRSGHCISIDETAQPKWGEWDTVVEGIRPNTDYVILGWRKQSLPAPGQTNPAPWLKVAVFGEMMPVKGTMGGGRWVPFALSVNSGDFEGDCNLGLVVDAVATKVWIDGLAMFEGTVADIPRFRLGLKGAALDYVSHDTVYASPDIQCPLFFDLSWSLYTANGNADLQIVVDLPEGLELTWSERGAGVSLSALNPELITIDGQPYVRWAFGVDPGEDGKPHAAAGRRGVQLWLKTDPTLGRRTVRAYYHARWRGGLQAGHALKIDVIQTPPTTQPRSLLAALSGLSAEGAGARSNILEKDLARLGLNGIVATGSVDPAVAGLFDRAGIAPGAWFALRGDAAANAEAAACDIEGNRVPERLCPCYRADNAIETVFAQPAELVKGGSTVLLTDLRNGETSACFCERCVKEFQTFLEQRNADLAFVSPQEFELLPDNFPELHAAWQEFRAAKLADLYWTLRKELDELRKSDPDVQNPESPLRLLAVVTAPGGEGEGAARIEFARLADVFDVEIVEPAMYQADGGGTPHWVGDEVARLAAALPFGGKAGAMVSAGSWSDPSAVSPVLRHSDVRDQVLEAVVGGAKAVILSPFYAVDGMDLKQFSEALGLLQPFDEIIAEAERVDVAAVVVGDGPVKVRALRRGDQVLLLVSDYAGRPAQDVQLNLGPLTADHDGPEPMVLVDAHSRSAMGEVLPDSEPITVSLGGQRARLFYLGPLGKRPFELATESPAPAQ